MGGGIVYFPQFLTTPMGMIVAVMTGVVGWFYFRWLLTYDPNKRDKRGDKT